jgi:hypothetical protein
MCLEVCRVDHHSLLFAVRRSEPGHHPREDAFLAPTLSAAVKRPMWTIGGRSVAPTQAIAIDEDNPAQHTPIIDARLAVRLRKERGKLGHLFIGQPVKVAHVKAPFSEP